jgi:hypothetical protein
LTKVKKSTELIKGFFELRGEKESEPDEQQTELPHYFIVINMDGVIAFTNSEQAEIIQILGLGYFVKRSAFSKEPEIVLETRYPFVIIGLFHGKEKPDLGKFLEPLFEELRRLSPNNADPVQTAGREFTASLQCVVADIPMRTNLKR